MLPCKTEILMFCGDETLECHTSILQSEGHPKKLEEAEWSDDGRLLHIGGMNRDLVVALLEDELAENLGPC